ncbi:MAG: sugar nucleotide-binding protein [Chloroflexi bacterium]|nr:sugar nucleotide-binding protein [Chloroflexota bacterium]
MKLLVTGGSGYVGAGILRRAPREWKIAATYCAHPIARANVAAFCVDVRDANAVNRAFDEFRPAVVIHTAALMSGDEMLATNVEGSRNVARAATRFNARLIHLSSDVIFDGEHAPYDEAAAPAPITPYAESKARAERAVTQTFQVSETWKVYSSALIVRTSLVYGFDPMDPRTRQTLAGEMPHLFTDEYRCPIFADDLADALLELAVSLRAERSNLHSSLGIASSHRSTTLPSTIAQDSAHDAPRNDKPGFSILNLAGAQRVSRYEFGVKLARALRVEPKFAPALSASSPTPRPRDCTLDITRAQRILRTRLRGVDEVFTR